MMRFQPISSGVAKAALQSDGVRALISELLQRGVNRAAQNTGLTVEDLQPKLSFHNNRWYGTYGAPAGVESRTSGLSNSVGG